MMSKNNYKYTCNKHIKDDSGYRLLYQACRKGRAEVVTELMDKARGMIDVNKARTKSGSTPLFIPCNNGHANVVTVLLDKARDTIDVNQAWPISGATPLFHACSN